ncbi:hypothetical protein [Lacticaseibacillus absianus]|uniref:hypothetical protein n=1 Tax=Lacticaseibacillus absianus TaxID=2729623 RepID=UPI0015C9C693|nr:hypothetical protein [Lacticaseibacillus absianus]
MKNKLLLTASAAAQLLILPLLLNRTQLTQLTLSTWALIAMALCLAWVNVSRDLRGLLPALVLAGIGAWGTWRLLPLALAQIALAALLASQNLQKPLALSGWQLEVAFVQLLLLAQLNQLITPQALLAVTFVTLPPLVAQWTPHLPWWATLASQVLIAGLAVWQQSFTWVTAAIALLCGTGLSVKHRQLPPIATVWAGVLISLVDVWTHLHG